MNWPKKKQRNLSKIVTNDYFQKSNISEAEREKDHILLEEMQKPAEIFTEISKLKQRRLILKDLG